MLCVVRDISTQELYALDVQGHSRSRNAYIVLMSRLRQRYQQAIER